MDRLILPRPLRYSIFLLFALRQFEILPVFGSVIRNSEDGMSFLLTYGYLQGEDLSQKYGNNMSMAMNEGLKDFQKFYHLPDSGVLDPPTLKMMNSPRCSNPERMEMPRNSYISRNSSKSRGWTYGVLRYSIQTYPRSARGKRQSQRERHLLEEDVRAAFAMWESVANISIERAKDGEDAEIKIGFVEGDHEDNMPFGERATGYAVAHAFFPRRDTSGGHQELEGDIHFDISQPWTFGNRIRDDGVNFRQVCAHEIGHALGLEHSMEKDAVMHMIVQPKDNFHLHQDDVIGIQNLYGPREPEVEQDEFGMEEVNDNNPPSDLDMNDGSNVHLDPDMTTQQQQQELSIIPKKPTTKPRSPQNHDNNYMKESNEEETYYKQDSNSVKNEWFIRKSYKKEMAWSAEQ